MKIRLIQTFGCLFILVFCILGTVPAAGKGSTITEQFFNGHMWALLSDSQKTTHLTGIQEGIQLCLSQIKADLLVPPALMHSMHESGVFERRRLLFSMQGISGISKRINGFYRDADNLSIPIIEAYRHVTLALNFAEPQEIADDLARLKLRYKTTN